jgi:hypothetical protein
MPIPQVLIGLFVKDLIKNSAVNLVKREAVAQIAENARVNLLKSVTEAYTRELTHNISQYVRSIAEASITVSSDNAGEKLFKTFQRALKNLEAKLEEQGPDSPVIKYLQEKYGERTESLVGLKTKPVYTIISGFSKDAWPDKPWLNTISDASPEIGDLLAQEASRIFDELFPSPKIP